jgi:hypothetical protein
LFVWWLDQEPTFINLVRFELFFVTITWNAASQTTPTMIANTKIFCIWKMLPRPCTDELQLKTDLLSAGGHHGRGGHGGDGGGYPPPGVEILWDAKILGEDETFSPRSGEKSFGEALDRIGFYRPSGDR